ncbi:ribosome quality control complex subunit NEMF homolog [Amyelois transitella]|uniref:ribosome quality control complex subunit NEMF homolog n=1 Tax=Amyelois transitella TaxID=680683 RepID=UPI00298FB482|nr:ribosome quality control complex subunit NEMF homolog [Amyelois transitella]
MKTRFNTYDIICMVTELQRLIGMRVNQVYDIDNRTYVIRLQRSEEKAVLLLESGNRFHTTQFEWPKNVAPSGFTMKLRKHLKNKRLEHLTQLGVDRIVDLQFGSGEAAYHVILELYDRGNIVLTDYEWTILNVLRPHVEGDKIRFAVKEKYPLDRAKTNYQAPNSETLKEILSRSRPGDNLKKVLNPNLEFGAAIIDHVLSENGLTGNMKISNDPNKGFFIERDLEKLTTALKQAEQLLDAAKDNVAKGYIIQKREERPDPSGGAPTFLLTNQEFHPLLYAQHRQLPHTEYETFDRAVDEFFSALEGQKIDLKTIQVEREAMKKLQNVRKDHEKRVTELEQVQHQDRLKAEMIARNEPLIEQARMAVQAAIANQMSWDDIKLLIKTAQDNQDPVASCIKDLKLNTNHVTLLLTDPYTGGEDEAGGEDRLQPMLVDIDLSLTAFANARRYYDQKRNAAKKQQKTLESADKALKSAERKTKQTLKEASTISSISKARRTYWFEKFYWFISTDNYLVIGGRDQQQNELLVKRYMRSTDVYVHAEVTGASSVIIKNVGAGPVPPRTLAEAGVAAVAYSVSWEAKVVTRAWWVWGQQVSKSAPTGEYLATGSFMVRGRKNYLLPDQLVFGFGLMFRLEDSCIERHLGERKAPLPEDAASEVTSAEDQEILVSDDDETSDKEDDLNSENQLKTIAEETTQLEISDKPPEGDTENVKDGEESEKHEKENEKREKDSEKHDNDDEKQQENEIEDGSESDSSSGDDFPDTHIKVDHGTGQVMMESKARTISETSDRSEDKLPSFPSLPKRGGKKPLKNSKEQKKQEEKKEGMKRGQRGKLKKIREKYHDQDEEDKAIALELLKASNIAKESKKAQKKAAAAKAGGRGKGNQKAKIPQPAPMILEVDSDADEPEPEADQSEAGACAADGVGALLDQLTGCPLPDDELLFAVPVLAPYTALTNYKYKVKLTPGTSKRGKAARTALQVFLREKAATPRERDLLKAVREENVARNFPGRVKLSAPQLHKNKK